MSKYYVGINRRGAIIDMKKSELRQICFWDSQPFVVWNDNIEEMCFKAWPELSKTEVRRRVKAGTFKIHPKARTEKDFVSRRTYDFAVIQLGKSSLPRVAVFNPELFNLETNRFKPGRGFKTGMEFIGFTDWMHFLNGIGLFFTEGR